MGEMGSREKVGIASEERDKEKLIKLCLGFGLLKLYKETGVLCTCDYCLPHGYIDV